MITIRKRMYRGDAIEVDYELFYNRNLIMKFIFKILIVCNIYDSHG